MRLTLVRHAHAVADSPEANDFQRPLSSRGREEAQAAAARFAAEGIKPDVLLSSPAARALETAEAFAEALGYDPAEIVEDQRLYLATRELIEEVLGELDPGVAHAVVFGHNPGLSDFAFSHGAPANFGGLGTAEFITIQ